MVKLLVLQQWHGLSDPELEKQVADRLSFMKFLGFPKNIPDFTTVWYFRERLAKTRRSKDGTWTKKGSKSYFGYKLHSKLDTDFGLIRDLETTSASVHDSKVDLSKRGEVVYRDRGFYGAKAEGYSATTKRGARDHPLGIMERLRNLRISKKRAPGERHYAVIKRVFNAGHVMVTTVPRLTAKMPFTAFGFNLYQLYTLGKQGIV